MMPYEDRDPADTVADELLLTVAQVGRLLQLSPKQIRRLEAENELPPARHEHGHTVWTLGDIKGHLRGADRFDSDLSPCPRCGRRWLGMDAPVIWLVKRAVAVHDDYGWVSAGLLQRRLRVTKRLSEYLIVELQDQGVIPNARAQEREDDKRARILAVRLATSKLDMPTWAALFTEYAALRGAPLDAGRLPYPSIAQLAAEVGVSPSTAYERLVRARRG